MDDHDRKRFLVIQVPFVERVDSIEMLGYITCLSEHTRDTVRNSQTAHNGSKLLAAQTLFAALKCRPDGLQQAAYALRKCGHDDLADKIDPQQASSRHLFQNPQRPHKLQAPYRNGAQNLPDGSPIYPKSYAMPSNQNPTPYQSYEPGRDTVLNFQNLNTSASLPEASNVGLPGPTWSMSQRYQLGMNSPHGGQAEMKNDLNEEKSDTKNEDSDFTLKKNIQQEENISSVSDSDSSKILNNQENAELKQSLTTNVNLSVKPQATGFDSSETTLKEFDNPKGSVKNIDNNATRTGFDSSETTLKSPITDDEHKDDLNTELSLRSEAVKNNFETEITQENVENIRQDCFSDVYSQNDSQLTSASEVSTERTVNVEVTQQPVDQSLEDAKIPVMGFLENDDERNSIMRKRDKANVFGIVSCNGGDDPEDGDSFVSYSEGSAVNSGEDIISTDVIPTTMGANTNEYFEQMNLNDHPEDSTKDQTKNSNVQKCKTATNNANNQTNNQQERGGVSTCTSDGNPVSTCTPDGNPVSSCTSDGNPIPSIQCPSLDTSVQFAGEYRVFDDIGQRPEAAENVRADNSTDERLTSWISFSSSLASLTYKVLHPDV